MTIIAYFKDALYADQLVLRYGGTPRERFQRKPKLFMSKCKTFAYAISGSVLTSKENGTLESMILGQIALAEDEKYFIRNGRHKDHDVLASVFEKLTKFLGASSTSIIAMTSESVFYINRSGAEFIEQDDFACSGSAEHIFTALMHEDPIDIKVAFEIMSNIEPTVSREFDVIQRSQLKPMQKFKEKKK